MQKRHKFYFILITFLFFCTIPGPALSEDKKKIITNQETYVLHTAIGSPVKEILADRIRRAFAKIDLNAKLVIASSSQRALMLANEDGDGDAFRVPDIKTIAPGDTANLIQVPESIIAMELCVYSKKFTFPVEGWHSLRIYRNGARLGAKIIEKNIPGKKTLLKTTAQLVQMLDEDRLDNIVDWAPAADYAIRNLKTEHIKKLSPPLKIQPFHIYLHKKHRLLVPTLTEAIKQIKADG